MTRPSAPGGDASPSRSSATHRGASERRLLHPRDRHRPAERVGHDLQPVVVLAAARRRWRRSPRPRAFARRPPRTRRRRPRAPPVAGRAASSSKVSPSTAPFACWCQPGLRSPPSSVRNVNPCESGSRSASEPSASSSVCSSHLHQAAAVRQRAAFDDATVVDPVDEETLRARAAARSRRRCGTRPMCRPSVRLGHGVTQPAPRFEQRAVEPRGIPAVDRLVGDLRQSRRLEPERRQQFLVPRARV